MTDRPDSASPVDLFRPAGNGRRRALFRAYLGYARGTGTTVAMLDEARRRAARGTDVLVAAYRVHGPVDWPLRDLEVMGPSRQRSRRVHLDVEAVLNRNPEVVCVDDLAELDAQGNPVWSVVPRLLGAGMTVLATIHVLSIRSPSEGLGVWAARGARESLIEDSVLASIEELELVDIPPDDLLERLRAASVLRPTERAQALQAELRPDVLGTLREMAFRIIADHEDPKLVGYLREKRAADPREVRRQVVLSVPARSGFGARIDRVARYAEAQDAKFTVVTVRQRGLSAGEQRVLGEYASLVHRRGGEFVRLEGRRVAPVLAAFVRETMAAELVVGHRRRRHWWLGSVTSQLIRLLSGVDVHILRA